LDTLLHDSIQFASKSPELKFNTGESFVEMFIYLFFVLALIFLCAFILKKTGFIQSKIPQKVNSKILEVLGQMALSQTEKIIIVKMIDTVQFILTSPNSSTSLKEMSFEEFSKHTIAVPVSDNSFKTIFRSVLKKDKNEG
jgi:flagellar biogenesis protein FliO